MTGRSTLVGVALAAFVGLLGWLSLQHSGTPDVASDGMRGLGTLMSLIAGVFSAIWWHQSADLSDRLIGQERPDPAAQREANMLNGAAATSTALALIASVFSGLPWPSFESLLAGGCFLALLAISGDDITGAAAISSRQKLSPRSILGFCILVAATVLFVHLHVLR